MTFLIPLIGLVAGIFTGMWASNSILTGGIAIIIAMMVYLYLHRVSRSPLKSLRLNKYHYIWIFLLFLGIGTLDGGWQKSYILSDDELAKYSIYQGEVYQVNAFASGDRLYVNINECGEEGKALKYIKPFKSILYTDGISANIGDIIKFKTNLKKIEDTSFRPDYVKSLGRKGIFYFSNIKSSQIRIGGHTSSLSALSNDLRLDIEIRIEKSALNRDTKDFIISILLGDRYFLNPEVRNAFDETGIAHILALSGLHVAIILGIFLFLLFPLQFFGKRNLRYILAIILMWGYTLVSGASLSTVRAAIMATFVMIAFLCQRKNNSLNALLGAAFIIYLIDPYAIYDIGLQLSLICVACLISFVIPLNPVDQHARPRLYAIISTILVSLVASFGTWALISYYFKRVSLFFLPANLLLLPLFPAFIFISFVYVVFLVIGIDIHLLAMALDFAYTMLIKTVEMLSLNHYASINFRLSSLSAILWTLGLLCFITGINLKNSRLIKKFFYGGGLGLTSLAIIYIFLIPYNPDESFILNKDNSSISVTHLTDSYTKKYFFKSGSIGYLNKGNHQIIYLDRKLNGVSDLKLFEKDINERKKYLLIARGFGSKGLDEIPGIEMFDLVIFHPSLTKNMENNLIEAAKKLGLKNLHSLRRDGRLEILLD